MATVNISDPQKEKVQDAVELISDKLGTKMSQAQAIEMGVDLLIEKYEEL
jgi:hypothetical protein